VPATALRDLELEIRPRRSWVVAAVAVPLVLVAWALMVGLAGDDSAVFGDVVLVMPFLVAWLYLVRRWSRCRVVVRDGVARVKRVFGTDELPLDSIVSVSVSLDRGRFGEPDLTVHGTITATGEHWVSICPWMWDRSDEWAAVLGVAVADREVDASPQLRSRLRSAATRHHG
jgi:hypothetical protein